MSAPLSLRLPRPDDAHVHLRDGAVLAQAAAATAAQFGRAVVMPNLRPPIRTTAEALDYRARILATLPAGHAFEPWMTLYLTDDSDPEEMARAKASGCVAGVKLYPAGATTHSDAGVTGLRALDDVLAAMAEVDLPLLVHGEVVDPDVDVFDREVAFLGRELGPLLARHPRLRVVLEHVTSEAGVRFVEQAPAGVAATLTAHHLLLDRNAMFQGGLRPHLYCLPLLKRSSDRRALLAAATSRSPRFFLGTDSAPHAEGAKLAACGCAGCYTAPVALQLYAEAFDAAGALDRLPDFASRFAAEFYGWPAARAEVMLERSTASVPERLPFGDDVVVPFRAGLEVGWRFIG